MRTVQGKAVHTKASDIELTDCVGGVLGPVVGGGVDPGVGGDVGTCVGPDVG